MIYVANAPLQAMELAALATEQCAYTDWWWKGPLSGPLACGREILCVYVMDAEGWSE
jgi:hypothetical protein